MLLSACHSLLGACRLLVDAVIYVFLAAYLDAVVPGNGPTKKWYFPIQVFVGENKHVGQLAIRHMVWSRLQES